jgi:hypothetical protein
MSSPVNAITVGAIVIVGVLLITQPFDHRSRAPGAAIDDPGPTESPSAERIGIGWDTAFVEHLRVTDWLLHESERYGYLVGYPPGWTVRPAERGWTYEADAADRSSPATEDLIAPDGDVRVSVWSVPLETVPEQWGWVPPADFVPWIESYCGATGHAPCTGILERAVPLCLERWDCHPGLMVPFDDAVQAFFSAGLYEQDQMVVMSVWGNATDPAIARYGGREALLEAFLSVMAVWPTSVPTPQRVASEVPR